MTKHIKVDWHFIIAKIESEDTITSFVNSGDQIYEGTKIGYK